MGSESRLSGTVTRLIILGLGPAAAAAALVARAKSVDVLMLGRTPKTGPRPGETLPPSVAPLLVELGIDDLAAEGHLPSPGTVSLWSDREPVENDFIFSPHGRGWHLDRMAFDQGMLSRAKAAGAKVAADCRLRSATQRDGIWLIQTECNGVRQDVSADFLIDATGRTSWLARQLRIARPISDRLVGIVGFVEDFGGGDCRTYLSAAQDGWWYVARIPGGRGVATYMTDSDIAVRHHGGAYSLWSERLVEAPCGDRLAKAVVFDQRVVGAGGSRLTKFCGIGWMAAGDAACSFDPLSSQGIAMALEGGARAGEAAVAALEGNSQSLTRYTQWLESRWQDYLKRYAIHYGKVRRWPEEKFWSRRQEHLQK